MRASRYVCIDPGDTYRWDYRLHRRARWSATGRTTIAIDGSAQPRLQGVTVGSVDDLQAMCDAIDINEMRPVIDNPVRPSCGGIPSHGKQCALRKSGHSGRIMMTR